MRMTSHGLLARRSGTVAVFLVAGVVVPFSTHGAKAALSPSSFTASGEANGFNITLTNSAVPLISAIVGGGPAAQAELDSLDQSHAYAAFPWPGEEEAGLPGLAGSVLGLPVPAYPLYVGTSSGQPPAEKNFPGINLRVATSRTAATSSATAGDGGVPNAESRVSDVLGDDGGVSTTSSAHVRTFNADGILRISGMESNATAKRSPDGVLSTSSDLSFGQITVPGLSLTLPATFNPCKITQVPVSGIPPVPCPAPFQEIPLPPEIAGKTIDAPSIGFENGQFVLSLPQLGTTKIPVPADSVFSAFKRVGVDVRYQAPQRLKNGIIAAGMIITQKLPAPPVSLPIPITGTPGATQITYAFGRSSALVDLSAYDDGSQWPASGPIGTPIAGDTGGVLSPGGGVTGLPVGGTLGTVPPTVARQGTGPTGQTFSAVRAARLQDSANIYLALVGAALLALFATQTVRIAGVRKLWAS